MVPGPTVIVWQFTTSVTETLPVQLLPSVAVTVTGKLPVCVGVPESTPVAVSNDIPLGSVYWRYQNLEIDRPQLKNLDRWFDGLKQREAYRQWVMVPLGRNPAEWLKNEAELR